MAKFIDTTWYKAPTNVMALPVSEALTIISDGQTNGFIFKISNHNLYTKMELNNTHSLITNSLKPLDNFGGLGV